MQLDQQVIAVTGGFGNLGMAVGRAIAAQGARLVLIDHAAAPAVAAPADALLLGGVDLSDADAAQTAVAAIEKKWQRLDGLVNIAGTFRWQTLEQGGVDAWDFLYKINLRTAVVASSAALPLLLKNGGRIVNIGANAAARAGAGMGAYAASKAGVARLTESLAEELKDRGVNVNAVLPSVIDTPQNRAQMPDADFSRWVAPEAIADVIVFLLSAQARAITGAAIPVTGRV